MSAPIDLNASQEISGRIQRVPVRDLVIDPSYQSHPVQKRIDQIALAWDPDLAGVLFASLREGRLYVVDGQHRMLGARKAGVTYLLAVVRTDLDAAGEANWAIELNENRRAHFTAPDLFRMRIAAGDGEAIDVQTIALDGGFSLVLRAKGKQSTSQWNDIGALNMLLRIYRQLGRDNLIRTLATVRTAADGRPGYTDGRLIAGVAETVWLYGQDYPHPSFSEVRLAQRLRETEPDEIRRIAAGSVGVKTGRDAASRIASPELRAAIVAIYNARLFVKNRLPLAQMRDYRAIRSGRNPWIER